MTRFFFNFRQGPDYTVDEVGCNFPSAEEAYLGAVAASQDMWRELLIRREDPLECAFDVTDQAGNDLFTLTFSEVLEACSKGPQTFPSRNPNNHVEDALERRRIARSAMRDFSALMTGTQSALRETMTLLQKIGKETGS